MGNLGPGLQTFKLAVDNGFDHIPDKVFSTPKEKRQQEERRRQEQQQREREEREQERNNSRGSEDSDRSPPPRAAQPPTRPRPPQDTYYQDPYAQDRGFSRSGKQTFSPTGRYDDYDERDISRFRSRDSVMQSDNSYIPPGQESRRNYNPSDYQPRDGGYDDRVGYRRDPASSYGDQNGRASSAGGRGGRYDDYDDDYDRSDRHERRKSRHHDSSSRASSEEGVRGQINKRFDKSEHGLATGALGALAGGVLGHEIGKKKGGVWPTVAGVVIGGLGANALEARHERKKLHREEERHRPRSVDGSRSRGYDEDDYDQDDRHSSGRRDRGDYYDDRDYQSSRYDRYDR